MEGSVKGAAGRREDKASGVAGWAAAPLLVDFLPLAARRNALVGEVAAQARGLEHALDPDRVTGDS
jgi:hypothetical protein